MAAPFFSTPFQPYVYESPQEGVTPFQIVGGESQIVQIMLKPREKVVAKPGTMCYMSGSTQMDNNYFPENDTGLWQWLFGKNVTSIVLLNSGPDDGYVGIAAPSPACIFPIDLAKFGGEIICQADAFLCSINDVTVTNTFVQRHRIDSSLREIILKQKLAGQGLAFLVAGGSVVQKILDVGEVLVVDSACMVAMTTTISLQLKHSNPMRRVVFGTDNQLMAVLTGPGVVFIQSLPFQKLSHRITRSVTRPNMRENPKFLVQIAVLDPSWVFPKAFKSMMEYIRKLPDC